MADCYSRMGQYERALAQHEQVRDVEVLGERHPSYLNTLGNMASCYSGMGQYERALALHEHVRDVEVEVLGERHPSYLNTLGNMASCYGSMGQYERALALHEQVRDGQVEVLGERHPEYLITTDNIVAILHHLRRYRRALQELSGLLGPMTEVPGRMHPHTQIAANAALIVVRNLAQTQPDDATAQLAVQVQRQAKAIVGEKIAEGSAAAALAGSATIDLQATPHSVEKRHSCANAACGQQVPASFKAGPSRGLCSRCSDSILRELEGMVGLAKQRSLARRYRNQLQLGCVRADCSNPACRRGLGGVQLDDDQAEALGSLLAESAADGCEDPRWFICVTSSARPGSEVKLPEAVTCMLEAARGTQAGGADGDVAGSAAQRSGDASHRRGRGRRARRKGRTGRRRGGGGDSDEED